jgi:hypothetical protein
MGWKERNTFQKLKDWNTVPCNITYLSAYLLTYLLHGAESILEKLTCSQLVKKFPAFYRTRRFTNEFTSARHMTLSWASSIQSMPPHLTFWRSILILSSYLRLALSGSLFFSDFPIKTLYIPLLSQYMKRAPPTSFFSIWLPERYWVRSTDN